MFVRHTFHWRCCDGDGVAGGAGKGVFAGSGGKAVAVYQWNGDQYVGSTSGQHGADVWGGDCEVAFE